MAFILMVCTFSRLTASFGGIRVRLNFSWVVLVTCCLIFVMWCILFDSFILFNVTSGWRKVRLVVVDVIVRVMVRLVVGLIMWVLLMADMQILPPRRCIPVPCLSIVRTIDM